MLALALALVAASTPPVAHGPLAPEASQVFMGSPADVSPPRLQHDEHYLRSNEFRQEIFLPVLEGKGGGYLGVGSDQNLLFIGWQRPELAWLTDYDDEVVMVNRLHLLFLRESPTAADFLALWDKGGKARARELIDGAMSGADRRFAHEIYKIGVWSIRHRLRQLLADLPRRGYRCYLNDPAQYDYVRAMVLEGRIRVMNGNLYGDKALVGVGEAARKLGVPIRAVYMSNAEEYITYTPPFRRNLQALFYDDASLILRTLTIPPAKANRYYYNIQSAKSFLAWLEGPATNQVRQMMLWREPFRPAGKMQEELTRLEADPQEATAPGCKAAPKRCAAAWRARRQEAAP